MASINTSKEFERSRIRGARLILCLFGWILSSFALGYATFALLPSVLPEWAGDVARLSAVIVAEVYVLLVLSILVAMGGIAETRERLRVRRVDAGEVGVTIGLWVGAYAVAFAAYSLLSTVLPTFPSALELVRFLVHIGTDMGRLEGADAATVAIVVVRACLLAPIAEELLFRGALFGWLRDRLPAWPTVVLTAVGFAAIHGIEWTLVPLTFVLGIAAGCARERTGSVTAPIAVHVLNNVGLVFAGVWSLQ